MYAELLIYSPELAWVKFVRYYLRQISFMDKYFIEIPAGQLGTPEMGAEVAFCRTGHGLAPN